MSDLPAGLTLDAEPAPLPAGLTLDSNEAAPSVPLPSGATPFNPQSNQKHDPEGQFISNTSIGRVLDAFKQGAKEAWGTAPLGISPGEEAEFRRIGLFPDPNKPGATDALRCFNEGLIRPIAATVDGLLRTGGVVISSYGSAFGQAANETGLSKAIGAPEDRAVDDFRNMGVAISTVLGGRTDFPISTYHEAQSLGVTSGESILRDVRGPVEPSAMPAKPGPDAAKPFTLATDEGIAKPQTISQPLPETRTIDKAGNIDFRLINSENDLDQYFRDAAQQNNDFLQERRGVVSLAESEAAGDALGIPSEFLMKRATGEALNDAGLFAARNAAVQSAEKLRELAIKAEGGTAVDQAALLEQVQVHALIQGKFSGAIAEAGRALNTIRGMMSDRENLSALDDAIKQFGGGRDGVDELARAIRSQNSPGGISKFLYESRKPTGFDKVIEGWMSGLLWGPKTHVANTIGNIGMMLSDLAETGVAEGIGKVRAATGDTGARTVSGETDARLYGILAGARDGVVAAGKAWREELSPAELQKWAPTRRAAIPSKEISIFGKTIEVGGKQIRTPLRLLSASDEFFKALARRQELQAQAWRQASVEGLTGDARATRVAGLLDAPTQAMKDAAEQHADYMTFTSELGSVGQKAIEFANAPIRPFGVEMKPFKFLVPFLRTPTNLFKRGIERTPLAAFNKDLWQSTDPIKRDMAAARLALGSAVTVAVVTLAAEDKVTGSLPKDRQERAYWRAIGRQPYSVKIGDTWYSYSRVEPFATQIGTMADAQRILSQVDGPDAEDVPAALLASTANTLLNKTSMTGLSDMIQAVTDPDRYGRQYVSKFVGSFVPAIVATAAQAHDPYLHDAKGILDTLETRIPGFSERVPLRYDVWGQPIIRGESFGPDTISPIYESREHDDPVAQELLSLRLFPGTPSRKISGVTLTPEQYDLYQRTSGRLMRLALENVVSLPQFHTLPDATRHAALQSMMDKAREQARAYVMMQFPEIIKTATELRRQQITGK